MSSLASQEKELKFLLDENVKRELLQFLKQQDIDVIFEPMKNGSWSRIVLESMACGVPVIAVEESGKSDFMIDDETGVIVRCQKDLYDALVCLLKDRRKREFFSIRSRTHVKNSLSSSVYSNKVLSIYEDVLRYRTMH